MADDSQYPYTTVPNRLRQVLEKIPAIGKPTTANQAWLKGLGYTSGNDKSILTAMRRVGMVGSGGAPTDFYDAVRNKDGESVAEHLQKAYADLFALYPDAHQKDDEALRNFFRSKTSGGDDVQRFMVRTFKVFVEVADFGGAGPKATVPTPGSDASRTKGRNGGKQDPVRASGGLTLNVNIQLQLPASAEGDVYEKLFAAMGKHLKGLATLE